MFEKEAEEFEESKHYRYEDNDYCGDIADGIIQAYQKGAEFGYNKAKEDADKMKSQFLELCNLKDMRIAELEKANEWHKPSEKLPEECSLVFAYLLEETEPTICIYVGSNQWERYPKRIMFCSNDQVRKWKEIVPPKKLEDRILESVKLNYESYVQEEKQFHDVGVDDELRKRQKGD